MTNSTNIKSLLIPHTHNQRGHLLEIITTYQAATCNLHKKNAINRYFLITTYPSKMLNTLINISYKRLPLNNNNNVQKNQINTQ